MHVSDIKPKKDFYLHKFVLCNYHNGHGLFSLFSKIINNSEHLFFLNKYSCYIDNIAIVLLKIPNLSPQTFSVYEGESENKAWIKYG